MEQPTWKVLISTNLPTTVETDVAAGQLSKFKSGDSTISEICGAGETPNGCFTKEVTIATEGESGLAVTQIARAPSVVVCKCAAAITDLTVPVKSAAVGQITPVTTDLDIMAGMPLNLQPTVGGLVAVDLSLMGSVYGTTP